MQKIAQFGKYIRSLAIPPWTSFTVLLFLYTAISWAFATYSVSWSYTQLVGLLGRRIQPIRRSLPTHRITQIQNKHMPGVGFELTAPVFGWAKTVHALDHTATVIDIKNTYITKIAYFCDVKLKTSSEICN
jgi:hypothetical protein